ncbi:hypothetical protein Scep_010389 [Stephania cephalantha]|uniref:Uncharacterized protein n=1 Tax=Stephania cephalantha TaxID=152367 RepID=A0AAP0PDA1_9MAGN
MEMMVGVDRRIWGDEGVRRTLEGDEAEMMREWRLKQGDAQFVGNWGRHKSGVVSEREAIEGPCEGPARDRRRTGEGSRVTFEGSARTGGGGHGGGGDDGERRGQYGGGEDGAGTVKAALVEARTVEDGGGGDGGGMDGLGTVERRDGEGTVETGEEANNETARALRGTVETRTVETGTVEARDDLGERRGEQRRGDLVRAGGRRGSSDTNIASCGVHKHERD